MPALTATFTDRALAVVEKYGFSVIPCQPRGKAPLRGAKSRTNTPNGVRAFASQIPEDANFGICADDRFTILETDNLGGLRTAMGRPLPRTFCVSARKNRGYFIFRQTPKTLAITKNYEWEGVFEWRHRNEYVIGPGSIHPDTLQEYQVVEDVPPIPFPDWLVDKLIELYRASPSIQKPGAPTEVDKDAYGRLREAYRENCSSEDMLRLDLEISMGRHGTMLSIAGLLHDGIRTEEEGIEVLRGLWDKFCTREPRGHEIEGIVEHAWKRDPCEIEPLNLPSPFSEGLKIFGTEAEFKAYLGEKAFQATKPLEEGFKFPKIPGKVREYVLMPRDKFDGWFGRGRISLVGGSSGAGKTTLICDLLNKQRIKNTPILGHLGAGLSPFIIFADRGELSNAETFDRLGLTDAGLRIGHLPVSWDDAAVNSILQLVEGEKPLPEVVFIEGADALVNDANKTQVVAPFLSGLQRMAAHYHIAVVLSVGAPKAKPKEQHMLKRDRIFGSQIWPRMSDTVLTLEAVGDGTTEQRELTVQHRNARAEKFNLEFRDGRLEEGLPEPADFDLADMWVGNMPIGEWVPKTELVNLLTEDGWSRAAAYRRIETLRKAGKINVSFDATNGHRIRRK